MMHSAVSLMENVYTARLLIRDAHTRVVKRNHADPLLQVRVELSMQFVVSTN